MFRLTGTDLPTVKNSPTRVVPAFRVWQGSDRGLGILARINIYANYSTPRFEIKQIDIPRPIASGILYKVIPPFTFKSPTLEGFGLLKDPTSPLPKTFWTGTGLINIYTPTPEPPTSIGITFLTGVPLAGRTVTLPASFAVTTVIYQGLTIPFTVASGQLTLNPAYPIPVGGELEIIGTYATAPQYIGFAATFQFKQFDFLDRFDWMGINFVPAPDATNPQVGQFVWSESLRLATVFSTQQIGTPSVNWDYSSGIGKLTY